MTDIQISCNLLNCRKKLNQLACVTSCLHIFCVNHMQNSASLENHRTCLACGNSLNNKFDLIEVNLNPQDQYKAMVLIGLHPDQIMQIANRAVNFFCYQLNYDNKLKDNVIQKLKDQQDQLKQYCEKLTNKFKIELHKLQRNIEKTKFNFQEKLKEVELQQQQIKEYRKANKKLHEEIEALKQRIIAQSNLPNYVDATFITTDSYFNKKINYQNKFFNPLQHNQLFSIDNNYKNPSNCGDSTNYGHNSP